MNNRPILIYFCFEEKLVTTIKVTLIPHFRYLDVFAVQGQATNNQTFSIKNC